MNYAALLFGFLAIQAIAAADTFAQDRSPNIILIMADDLGFEWLGCYGNDDIRTPRLDALASEGMRFDHCYSTPLCTPSRVCIMTGKYNHRNYEHFGTFPLAEEQSTFGNAMNQAGYATCLAGKWQLGKADPGAMGFDRYLQYGVNQSNQQNYYWNPTDKSIVNRVKINGKAARDITQDYGPDIVTGFITSFINDNRERPFFIYYPMLLCHAPFQPTPQSKDKEFNTEPKYSNKDKWYADMVEYTDAVVGRIVDHLQQTGLRENTLLLFTGDNGSPYTASRVRGRTVHGHKGRLTDAGTHVPLIASWPGVIPEGSVCTDLVDFTDFYATITDLAGVKTGPSIDGVSFLTQLTGKKGKPRDWAFVFYTPNQPGKPQDTAKSGYWARTRHWKLYHDDRLFDMQRDSAEKNPILPAEDTEACRDAREFLKAAFDELGVNPAILAERSLQGTK